LSTLLSLRIRNYRCFDDHTVDFGRATIVVGKNNAGKSTLIEAIRLVAVALKRFRNPVATPAPRWLDDFAPGNGQRLDLSRLGVQFENIFHRYGDPPAILEATFADRSRLVLFIGAEGVGHAVFFSSRGRAIRARRDIGPDGLPSISILPQVTPLEKDERVLDTEYVKQNLDSSLSSRHFRNQLMVLRQDHFESFRDLVEQSWRGVRIEGLEIEATEKGNLIRLMIRDGNFVAEVGWMGHGLQMWLQTLWFVQRSGAAETLVLDEPDVYMHPDLQRRLVRLLMAGRSELVVATHSTEILSEVDASNVLILDRAFERSTYADGVPAVQRIVEQMGSAQNLQIARLWKARVLILVEGDDMRLLKRVHDLVSHDGDSTLDAIPNWPIGGWTGWANAVGSVAALKNAVHERIVCFCLFDSDYHLPKEIAARYEQARAKGIDLLVLSVKEIENFLIRPGLIRRVLERNCLDRSRVPSEGQISEEVRRIANELLPSVVDSFVESFLLSDRAAGAGTASRRAREHVDARLADRRGLLGVVPGKELLSRLSGWTQDVCGTSFGVNSLIREIRRDEVDAELAELIARISAARVS